MKLIIAMIVLALGSFAHAQSRIVSIDAFDYAYSGGLLMKSDEGKTTDREETTFKLNLPTTPPSGAGAGPQQQMLYPTLFPDDPISAMLQQRQQQQATPGQ